MGLKMKYYFDLYNDTELEEITNYTFEFHEYFNNMLTISCLNLSNCSFSKKYTRLTKSYHGILRNEDPVKNTVKLTDKNIILSGPNASGKTTLLKSTAINLILSQQFGCGFYEKAKINPYHYFHCYINIPDTCDRDSLFQAEARRCRNIISKINSYSGERHLCLFDELFSGTNPYEAVASATGYLEYLNKNKNIRFILTTHYLDLCEHFNQEKYSVDNYTLERKYIMDLGISKVKGGIRVLEELEFPEDILKTAKKMVSLN
jgi:DNA mismatch repair ATPase MutS